jgi:hypothetical protein
MNQENTASVQNTTASQSPLNTLKQYGATASIKTKAIIVVLLATPWAAGIVWHQPILIGIAGVALGIAAWSFKKPKS